MAIDRNKTAQQAERLVAQGKIVEAIAQYESLVRDNPRDMNTINKIGDLYSRQGKKRDAILQFNKIGEFYAKDGFFLKAIAIYKKIIKLDPSFLDAYQRLADLYAQQGLVLEARSQYQMVAEQYLKAGDVRKAIAAYQALVGVDPENLKHRTHLANLLAKAGSTAEAAEEYARLGAELERKGNDAEARAMYQKGSTLQPGSPALVARLAGKQAAAGDIEGGIKMVKEALRKPGDYKELLATLGDLHLKAGQHDEAQRVLGQAIEAAPDHLDLRLRLARVQIEKGDAIAAYDAIASHLPQLSKQGHAHDSVALLELISQIDKGHVDALMRLAELYAAYKKESDFSRCAHRALDLCIDSSDYGKGKSCGVALVKLRPNDRTLKEKLDLLHVAETTARQVGGQMTQQPKPAERGEGRTKAARAAPPDPRASAPSAAEVAAVPLSAADFAGVLDLPPPPRLEPEDEDFITEHMTEAEVFVKYGLGDRAIEQLLTVIERYPSYTPALSKLKEIYLEEGNREGARQQMAQLVKAHLAAGEGTAAGEALAELKRFDPNCREAAELSASLAPGRTESGAATGSMGDAVMEAGVGFRDAGGETSMTGADSLEADEPSFSGMVDAGDGIESADAIDPTVTVDPETDERAPTRSELEVVDAYLSRASRQEAVTALRQLALECGSHPEIVSRMKAAMALSPEPPERHAATESEEFEIALEENEEPQSGPGMSATPQAQASSDSSSDLNDLSDLASEIDAALMGASGQEESLLAGSEASPEGNSLEEIVEAFKKGIETQIAEEDYDTHYNLGIAYKEMGLMDEAIGEFQYAAKDARLLVDCCSMLGICFREKGMSTLAVKWYRRGLESSGSRDEELMLGLRYDLAELLVEVGEQRQAMDLFTEVFGINSKYRDVAARIKDLERHLQR